MSDLFQNIWMMLVYFMVGAAMGSFLHVVYVRGRRMREDWKAKRPFSITWSAPASHCFSCGTPLKWHDNLPVLGWTLLGGKCRTCHQPFSVWHLWYEVLCGVLGVWIGASMGLGLFAVCFAVLIMLAGIELMLMRGQVNRR
jgi:leader peptidase (prepilin peptidase)/N-methyltransferase